MSAIAKIAQEQYRKHILRWLMKRLRNPHDIEDITQDIMLRLMATNDSRVIEKPLAYMYGTAAHVLADYFLEREKRRAVVFDDEAVEEGLKKELMVEDQIADQINLQQQIDKAIGQLPSTHAAVLLAHKGEGLSYEEVAEKLGLSIHTVEKYVTQSKFILRKVEWDR